MKTHTFRFGEPLTKPKQDTPPAHIRLYTLQELRGILGDRGLQIKRAYGDYDVDVPASDDTFTLVVHSEKSGTGPTSASSRRLTAARERRCWHHGKVDGQSQRTPSEGWTSMTRDEVLPVLATDSLFSDLRSCQIEWLEPGKRSHPCRIRGGWSLFAVLDTSMGKQEIAAPHGR